MAGSRDWLGSLFEIEDNVVLRFVLTSVVALKQCYVPVGSKVPLAILQAVHTVSMHDVYSHFSYIQTSKYECAGICAVTRVTAHNC